MRFCILMQRFADGILTVKMSLIQVLLLLKFSGECAEPFRFNLHTCTTTLLHIFKVTARTSTLYNTRRRS